MFFRLSLLTLLMSLLAACGGTSGTEGENQSYNPHTFSLSGNELACIEFTAYSQADEYQIQSLGGTEGFCSQSDTLGSCHQYSNEYSYTFNTIYYKNAAGAISVQALKSACEQVQGSFTSFDPDANTGGPSDDIIERTYIVQQDSIACTEYLSSTLAGQGQIVGIGGVEGRCSRDLSLGTCQRMPSGDISTINTVYYRDEAGLRTAESLVPGCDHIQGTFINAETGPGNVPSEPASLNNLDTDADGFTDVIEAEYGTDALDRMSTPVALLNNIVDFTDDNDGDGFSDEMEIWLSTDPNIFDQSPVDEDGNFIPDGFDTDVDVIKPRLLAFDMPNSIVIETGSETVNFNLTVADNLSGVGRIDIVMISSTRQTISVSKYGDALGNKVHALSLNSSAFGEFSEAGVWAVDYIRIEDVAGNYKEYKSSDLQVLSLKSSIDVENINSDVVPPVLSEFSIVDDSITILTGQESVSFNVTVTDNYSGFGRVDIIFISPTGKLISATDYTSFLGQSSSTLTLTSSKLGLYAEAGSWTIKRVSIEDLAGNQKHFYAADFGDLSFESELIIHNDNSDLVAPILSDFSVVEESIDIVSGQETVSFNLTVVDSVSGVGRIDILLKGPTGQAVYVSKYGDTLGQSSHTLTLESSEFGEFAITGTWTIEYVRVEDIAGNNNEYSSMALNDLAFDNDVVVSNL